MQTKRSRGTFIVRVVAQEMGTVQGTVEHVQSGTIQPFGDEEELVELVKQLSQPTPTKEI